ncbi:hypothetical protein [Rhodocaloribacter sp.]|jgi:hypothetical protein
MSVQREDVFFMMREVFRAAFDLLEGSEAFTDTVSHVRTAHLNALHRSLEDLVAIRKAFDDDHPAAF